MTSTRRSFSSHFTLAVLAVTAFQALATVGSFSAANLGTEESGAFTFSSLSRSIASSGGGSDRKAGARVLIISNLDENRPVEDLGSQERGEIIGRLDDGRLEVRHELRVSGMNESVRSTRLLDQHEVLKAVDSVAGYRIGDRILIDGVRPGRITGFYERGVIEASLGSTANAYEFRTARDVRRLDGSASF